MEKNEKVCAKAEKKEEAYSKALFSSALGMLSGVALCTFFVILFDPLWGLKLDRAVVPGVATALLLLLGSAIAKIVESKKQ